MELENSKKYENNAGFMGAHLQWRDVDLSYLYWKIVRKKKKDKL